MSKNRNRAYSNNDITVVWQARECTHATLCYTELRSVFNPIKRPWININGSSSERILEIVEKCPTKALTFFWNDPLKNLTETSKKLFTGSLPELLGNEPATQNHSETQATLNIRANGPIVVSGNFELIDGSNGETITNEKIASICRCGRSENMPHCDGAHFKIGFQAK